MAALSLSPQLASDVELFLAFDYGEKRTGVASGNRLTLSATPLGTIAAQGDAKWQQIGRYIADWQPQALVIGVPRHPDGQPHQNTVAAQRFGRQLSGRFNLPVFETDERYTTTEALTLGAKDADAAAACIILEQFLRSLTP